MIKLPDYLYSELDLASCLQYFYYSLLRYQSSSIKIVSQTRLQQLVTFTDSATSTVDLTGQIHAAVFCYCAVMTKRFGKICK
jgi:hypothetical protein